MDSPLPARGAAGDVGRGYQRRRFRGKSGGQTESGESGAAGASGIHAAHARRQVERRVQDAGVQLFRIGVRQRGEQQA